MANEPAVDELCIPARTDDAIAVAVRRYWAAWPEVRNKILDRHKNAVQRLREIGVPEDLFPDNASSELLNAISSAQLIAIKDDPRQYDLFMELYTRGSHEELGGPLGAQLFGQHQLGIALLGEIEQMSDAELSQVPPVTSAFFGPEYWFVGVAGDYSGRFALQDLTSQMSSASTLILILDAADRGGLFTDSGRAAWRQFGREFWPLMQKLQPDITSVNSTATDRNLATFPWPHMLPQPTFEEVKRLGRGFSQASKGTGWSEDVDEIALIHDEKNRARYNLRLEGALIPEWWGRPNNSSSLMHELRKVGPHATAMLLVSVGLLVTSPTGHVDFDIDDLLKRAGIVTRSSRERLVRRHEAWRILTLIGATRVVGERRKKLYDRTTRRYLEIESTDPLLTVSPWVERGAQISFDASAPPIRVSASAGRLIDEWRGNRSALQYFGDVVTISSIQIGKTPGEWARALGFALQQLWREQATTAKFGRRGDEHRTTAEFRPFTRAQLLGMFPPQISVDDVLSSNNPARAIEYWDVAVAMLRERHVVGHYSGSRDWVKDRPRKGWAELWREEPLDIRPSGAGMTALSAISASSTKRRKRRPPTRATKA